MAEWTHNFCERCWFSSPFAAHESGGFRLPSRVKAETGDVCCSCGSPTVSGIYVRRDETTLLCKGDHEHPDRWSPFIHFHD